MPKINYSTYRSPTLLLFFYTYTQCGLSIEPELNAALAERFSDYNSQLQRFATSQPKIDLTDTIKIKQQLNKLYHSRFKNNLAEMPENLNTVIAYYFNSYNPETRKFVKQTSAKSYADFADSTLRHIYYKKNKQKLPIPDEINTELANRFSNYDPETKKFIKKTQTKPYAEFVDSTLRQTYYKYKRQKLPIPEELNVEMANRFPGYDPEQKIFDVLEQIRREEARAEKLHKLVMKSKNKKIIVSVQTVGFKEDVTYNDVFINGTKILSNHIDTEIKLLCDDTILAIHGIITNDPHYPDTPTWLAYNAQMKSLSPIRANSYSNYYVQINNIRDINNKVNIFFNNKTTMILNKEKLKKLANGYHFVLETQKTR